MHQPLARRTFLGLLGASAVALTACGDSTVAADGSVNLSEVELTVGDQARQQRALMEAAGELEDIEFQLDWADFAAAAPLLEALTSGAIDLGIAGDAPTLNALASGANIKIVSAIRSPSQGGLALLLPRDSGIKRVADLRGRTVSPTTQGSIGHYLLLAALDEAGVAADDVRISFLEPVNANAALRSGAIDAWSTWDPYTASAEVEQGATVLRDSQGLTHGLTFLDAYQEALDDPGKRAAIRDFVERYNRSLRWALDNHDEYTRLYAELTGRPESVASAVTERAKRTGEPVTDQVVRQLQEVADNYRGFGVLRQPLTIREHVVSEL
ncbi:sulfonate transport system substrate-binding protein [Tamaricihabitans halophyticus]|uniref:Putative aliphatic sulfonates-binding protein n=1 Tax=Tamaricihabitans halophyticus TaxID=1262583 RepID=A0A4R2QCY6_9PSEU|nr:ABC transporter substrate-binding protein [Tamaricihabitans halophyticus]TCP46827.1 sulfonate transport system substrate-binding protein [Tamaricihabitans halophyticus]